MGLLVSLVATDANVLETKIAPVDDRDGSQQIQIQFQDQTRGTGNEQKGDLFIDLDDITCEILDYNLSS